MVQPIHGRFNVVNVSLSKVKYSLFDKQYERMVHVNPDNGIITARVSFDLERFPSINTDGSGGPHLEFTVVAYDEKESIDRPGATSLSSTALVRLTIGDRNAAVTVPSLNFDRPRYMFAVHENRASRTPVGSVVVAVVGGRPGNRFPVIYDLQPENSGTRSSRFPGTRETSSRYCDDGELPFTVDRVSGNIVTTATLDRERCDGYLMTVFACVDSRNFHEVHTATARVEVSVCNIGSL